MYYLLFYPFSSVSQSRQFKIQKVTFIKTHHLYVLTGKGNVEQTINIYEQRKSLVSRNYCSHQGPLILPLRVYLQEDCIEGFLIRFSLNPRQ